MIRNTVPAAGGDTIANAAVSEKGKVHRHAGARPKAGEMTLGFSTEHMDPAADPAQDFYRYAAGRWLDQAVIDDAQTQVSGIKILAHRVNNQVLALLQEAAANSLQAAKGSVEQQVGDFFASAMQTERLDALGIRPLQPQFERIEAIATPADLAATAGHLAMIAGCVAFVAPYVMPDKKQNDVNALMLLSAVLPLGKRDMYLDDGNAALREAYLKHVKRMLVLSGTAPRTAARHARTVLALETALAEASMSPIEALDPNATYNKMSAADMKALAPHFDFNTLFAAVGLKGEGDVIVADPNFVKAMDTLLVERPLKDLKIYLRWRLINSMAQYLSPTFDEADLDFYAKTMDGQTKLLPREERVASEAQKAVGHPVSQLYVRKYFPEETRLMVTEIVDRIRAQFERRLLANPWLDKPTRAAALDKLSKLVIVVGHPTKWIDHSTIDIRRDDYLGNAMRLNEFGLKRVLELAGRPVVHDEFAVPGSTQPTDINAAYQWGINKIELCAAILQPPFFDPALDPAVNYGTIGAVIGHEITHGFDSIGRLFDADGNLNNWWTDGDTNEFTALAGRLGAQYDQIEVLPGVHVSGELTLPETVADLGGLTLAYNALQEVLAESPGPGTIDGLTAEQRFFIAWAQLWMSKDRPEWLRTEVMSDSHPPSPARATGSSINMKAFYDAFSIKPGDATWRDEADRVEIW